MQSQPVQILAKGAPIVAGVLAPHGFVASEVTVTRGSGGVGASCNFIAGTKRLELHYRDSLGLVTYHVGRHSLSHEDYMHLAGHKGRNEYPGFPDFPLQSFDHLAHDLSTFCANFVSGDGSEIVSLSQMPPPPRRLP